MATARRVTPVIRAQFADHRAIPSADTIGDRVCLSQPPLRSKMNIGEITIKSKKVSARPKICAA
jgi:hypothetical protein